MRLPTLTAAALLFLGAPAAAGQRTVSFKTSDGCALTAFYQAPSTGAYVLINVHGLGSSRYEWDPFQAELRNAGMGYLSLDLRGHNDSRLCGGKKADYRAFDAAGWKAASLDIEAAAAWLVKKGIGRESLVFCGASVGANLSLKAAAEGKIKPAALVLLSPGAEYTGIKAGDYLGLAPGTRLLTAASANDPYAWRGARLISGALNAPMLDGGGGHGADMLKNPGTAARIIDWLSGGK